ncbi:MAG: WG repeat-containing protein [Mariniphaga sp.]
MEEEYYEGENVTFESHYVGHIRHELTVTDDYTVGYLIGSFHLEYGHFSGLSFGEYTYLICDITAEEILVEVIKDERGREYYVPSNKKSDGCLLSELRNKEIKLNEILIISEKAPRISGVKHLLRSLAEKANLFTKEKGQELIPFRKGETWGFSDRNKNILIECIYHSVTRFVEGIAVITKGNDIHRIIRGKDCVTGQNYQKIFINEKGKIIYICEEDEEAEAFHDGIAKIESAANENYIYINKNGEIILRLKDHYFDGDNRISYNDFLEFQRGLAIICQDKKWGYFDLRTKESIPCKYTHVLVFNEGFAGVEYGKWGFINRKGDLIAPLKYDKVYSFSEGIARVELNGKMGLINNTGKEIIPCKYDDILEFSEGLAGIKKGDKWGFIEASGKEVIECKYENLSSFSPGTAGVVRESLDPHVLPLDNFEYLIRGKLFRESDVYEEYRDDDVYYYKYDNVLTFREGVARVPINHKWSLINKSGKEIIASRFDDIRFFCEGFAAVMLNNKWGFINNKGKLIVDCKYDEISDFKEGMARVKHNGQYGFIDILGKEIIDCKYDGAGSFTEGFAIVSVKLKTPIVGKHGSWVSSAYGFVDKSGRELQSCKYYAVDDFNEGFAAVKVNEKWGFIDKSGKLVIECKYVYVDVFYEGLAEVMTEVGMLAYIDKNGTEYWED